MAGFAAAISFLTRLPVANRGAFDAKEVARSARWFPLVGLLLGGVYAAVLWLCSQAFPALVTGVILACVDAALTGALHLDGLADTADGFGGRTREDVLHIMRDHAIGAYGAVALVLALLVRVASVAALIELHAQPGRAMAAVVLAPVLGRWTAVVSGASCDYARPEENTGNSPDGSPARWIGSAELIVASVSVAAIAAAVVRATSDPVRGPAAWALVAIASAFWIRNCRRRLGGVTGDTLGAGIELSECLVFLLYLAMP